VSVYVPFGWEESAFTPYQTVVASFDAVVEVVLIVFGEADEGTPAHVDELEPLFVSAEYAVPPNPPTPTMRYPHLLEASAVGEAWVPA